MKKDIGSRSFVEMYLITKEDKNLFDKCVNHMSQNARGKPEDDFSSTVLSQYQTVNTFSSDDKKDDSAQPSSEESSISAKDTNTSQNIDGSTVERSVDELENYFPLHIPRSKPEIKGTRPKIVGINMNSMLDGH